MPLKKKPTSDNRDHEVSSADNRVEGAAGFERVSGARRNAEPALQDEFPQLGEFFVDYTPLSADEIAETDEECAELFRHSKPISNLTATDSESDLDVESDLECAELFRHSKPISR